MLILLIWMYVIKDIYCVYIRIFDTVDMGFCSYRGVIGPVFKRLWPYNRRMSLPFWFHATRDDKLVTAYAEVSVVNKSKQYMLWLVLWIAWHDLSELLWIHLGWKQLQVIIFKMSSVLATVIHFSHEAFVVNAVQYMLSGCFEFGRCAWNK